MDYNLLTWMWINAKQMNKMDFYTVKTITKMVSDYIESRGIRPNYATTNTRPSIICSLLPVCPVKKW